MSDPVLHIKDSFFFEVPKVLAPAAYKSRVDFPDVWISLDPDFQEWEFHRLYHALESQSANLPAEETAHHDWHEWVHSDHANFAKPFDEFLEHKYREHLTQFRQWQDALVAAAKTKEQAARARNQPFDNFILGARSGGANDYSYWSQWRHAHENQAQWAAIR